MVAIIVAIFLSFVGLFIFDSTELTHYEYTGTLLDKWHEESCSPIYGDKGDYYGESCSDEYTVILDVEGKRVERRVSNSAFNQLLIGTSVEYSFDLGKLGIEHNASIIGEKK